jgi:hypothetical protein
MAFPCLRLSNFSVFAMLKGYCAPSREQSRSSMPIANAHDVNAETTLLPPDMMPSDLKTF